MIYLSTSLSLAVLEVLVHSPRYQLLQEEFVYFSVNIPDDYILSLDNNNLPKDWNSNQLTSSSQTLGDRWLHDAVSLALMVPSRIIPIEKNVLVNPKHRNINDINIGKFMSFDFDPRL